MTPEINNSYSISSESVNSSSHQENIQQKEPTNWNGRNAETLDTLEWIQPQAAAVSSIFSSFFQQVLSNIGSLLSSSDSLSQQSINTVEPAPKNRIDAIFRALPHISTGGLNELINTVLLYDQDTHYDIISRLQQENKFSNYSEHMTENGAKNIAENTTILDLASYPGKITNLVEPLNLFNNVEVLTMPSSATGEDLKAISQLKNLRELNLRKCGIGITDTDLALLANITTLQSLDLSHCYSITDASVAHIVKNFPSLQSLDLCHCSIITDTGIAILKALTNLQSLDLTDCNVTGACFTTFGNLTSLKSLHLKARRYITDTELAILKTLTNLQSLDLKDFRITDSRLATLESFTDLKSLNLGFCMLTTGADFEKLGNLSTLKSIDLSFSDITDTDLEKIGKLTALKSLDLRFCEITDIGLAKLTNLKALQFLNFEGCNHITNAGLLNIAKNFPAMRLVKLRNCYAISNDCITKAKKINPLITFKT